MARGYKTGGRKTGTPNKTTSITRDMISQVLAGYHDEGQLARDFFGLEPKERLNVFVKLLGYILPKPQSIDLDVSTRNHKSGIEEILRQLAEENE